MPEIHRFPRVPNLRTNCVQTIPRIPEPPTVSPSNPFSGPSEEFFIVYTSNRHRGRSAFDENSGWRLKNRFWIAWSCLHLPNWLTGRVRMPSKVYIWQTPTNPVTSGTRPIRPSQPIQYFSPCTCRRNNRLSNAIPITTRMTRSAVPSFFIAFPFPWLPVLLLLAAKFPMPENI